MRCIAVQWTRPSANDLETGLQAHFQLKRSKPGFGPKMTRSSRFSVRLHAACPSKSENMQNLVINMLDLLLPTKTMHAQFFVGNRRSNSLKIKICSKSCWKNRKQILVKKFLVSGLQFADGVYRNQVNYMICCEPDIIPMRISS